MTEDGELLEGFGNSRDVLGEAEALLLDFDGPICSIFAKTSASYVAGKLRTVLKENLGEGLPVYIEFTQDPFKVLQYASFVSEKVALIAESVLAEHEAEAVGGAMPTPGSHSLIESWGNRGSVFIVSNNSTHSIRKYLQAHALDKYVRFVSGRNSRNFRRLKPDPFLIHELVRTEKIDLEKSVFIGDSESDFRAARAAKVKFIGYANKPYKFKVFADLRANAITPTMSDLIFI